MLPVETDVKSADQDVKTILVSPVVTNFEDTATATTTPTTKPTTATTATTVTTATTTPVVEESGVKECGLCLDSEKPQSEFDTECFQCKFYMCYECMFEYIKFNRKCKELLCPHCRQDLLEQSLLQTDVLDENPDSTNPTKPTKNPLIIIYLKQMMANMIHEMIYGDEDDDGTDGTDTDTTYSDSDSSDNSDSSYYTTTSNTTSSSTTDTDTDASDDANKTDNAFHNHDAMNDN